MADQIPKVIIELDRKMRDIGFTLWNYTDGWKCPHCKFMTEELKIAKTHIKIHKKLEDYGIAS